MKKILLLCGMIVALLTACSEQQTMESILDEEFVNIAKGYISASQAVDIANDFAADFNDEPGSRSENRKASSTRNVMTIRARASRSAEDLIYVVNYDDDQGFALVSKKETSTPVLAFIPQGSYSEEAASKIEGFQDFVTNANEYIIKGFPVITDTIPRIPLDSITEKKLDSIPTLDVNVDYFNHFIHLNWAQDGVFGTYCPNGLCGCGPLAFAMLCAHYEKPSIITITFDGSNRVIELDWKKIKSHFAEKSGLGGIKLPNPDFDLWPDCRYSSCTKETHDQLALFVRQLGHDYGAVYSRTSTDIAASSIYEGMTKYTDYHSTPKISFRASSIKFLVSRNKPVIMWGNSVYGGMHMWICDGYLSKDQDNDGVQEDYLHYNWGCGGEFNGFFLSGVFQIEGLDNYSNVKYYEITLK